MKLGPILCRFSFENQHYLVGVRNKAFFFLMRIDYVTPGGDGGHGLEPSVHVTQWLLSKHRHPGGKKLWERTIWERRK